MLQGLYTLFMSKQRCHAVQQLLKNGFNIRQDQEDSMYFPDSKTVPRHGCQSYSFSSQGFPERQIY